MSAINDQLTNQCRSLWPTTFEPSVGHKWPTGRVLDAPALIACTVAESLLGIIDFSLVVLHKKQVKNQLAR